MQEAVEEKRLFFGMLVKAPWPEILPKGRVIDEEHRHLTLAFLGSADYQKLRNSLSSFPQPTFKVGLVGEFDQCLFLPPRHPRLVAWHLELLENAESLLSFQKNLIGWLQKNGFSPDTRHDFHPHITICRDPHDLQTWKKSFKPLPFWLQDIHLFESLGRSQYRSLWSFALKAPFEEIDHTADIGFVVRGETLAQLFSHAQVALAFAFPSLLPFLENRNDFSSIDDIVIALNQLVSKADAEIGVPFKAVSFHGKVTEEAPQLLRWEMIVDV